MSKSKLDAVIKNAAARGAAKRKENLAAAEKAAAAQAKKVAKERAAATKTKRDIFKVWVRDELPNVVEAEAAKGNSSLDLKKVKIPGDEYCQYTSVLAEVCQEAGLTVDITNHYVEEGRDIDYSYDAYTYYSYILVW